MFTKIFYPTIFFLLPLLFLPFTPNIFGTPKELLLVVALIILILASALRTISTRKFATSSSPLRFALGSLFIVIILSLALHSEGRTEAILGTGSVYLALCVWSYFMTMQDSHTLRRSLVFSLLGATSALALHSLLQLTLLFHLTFLPAYMQSLAFSLTGSPLTTFFFLVFGLGISLIFALKSTVAKLRPLFVFLVALHAVSLISLGFLLLPGQELSPTLLPLTASWSIALDAMKSLRPFFLGVGMSNFADFAATVKPLFLNTTVFWNQSLGSSGSELLQVLTTTGVLGLLAFLAIPFVTYKFIQSHPQTILDPTGESLRLLAILSGLTFIIAPATLPILFVFFTTLGLISSRPVHTHSLNLALSLASTGALVLSALIVGYYASRAYAAEWHIHNAQVALTKSDGKAVYDENLAAIRLLPALTSYHLSYSQVNMSLASALSQKSPLSDTDRQNITQLVSQAVTEGKNATILRPHSAITWQNLGIIYRNLINVADGTDQFAISAYTQAVTLDPGNPALRVEYGGLLYQLGIATKVPADQTALYTQAQTQLQTAISLKSDYANAYYNLSKLLETAKDYSNSYLAMQKAISLLGPNSPDLSRATSELDALKSKLPAPTPSPSPSTINDQSSTKLAQPSPLPSPLPGGRVALPTSSPVPSPTP